MTRDALIRKARADILKVESKLREVDDADDQIGAHAADAGEKCRREMEKRAQRLGPTGNDPDEEDEYLHIGVQNRFATQVLELAELAKAQRRPPVRARRR